MQNVKKREVCSVVTRFTAHDNELSALLCTKAKHDTQVSQQCGGKLYFAAILTILCHVPGICRGNVPTWELHNPT
jgi:hypothetical protein